MAIFVFCKITNLPNLSITAAVTNKYKCSTLLTWESWHAWEAGVSFLTTSSGNTRGTLETETGYLPPPTPTPTKGSSPLLWIQLNLHNSLATYTNQEILKETQWQNHNKHLILGKTALLWQTAAWTIITPLTGRCSNLIWGLSRTTLCFFTDHRLGTSQVDQEAHQYFYIANTATWWTDVEVNGSEPL